MILSVVVPVYNEEGGIGDFHKRLYAELSKFMEWEIIYSVGGTDRTLDILLDYAIKDVQHIKITYEEERGLGKGLRSGFARCDPTSKWIMTLDGDGQFQPEEISKLYARANIWYDCTVGKFALVDKRPLRRRIISRIGNWLMVHWHGLDISNITSDNRLYRASELRKVLPVLHANDFQMVPEILIRMSKNGALLKEVPISYLERKTGASKARMPVLGYLRLLFI